MPHRQSPTAPLHQVCASRAAAVVCDKVEGRWATWCSDDITVRPCVPRACASDTSVWAGARVRTPHAGKSEVPTPCVAHTPRSMLCAQHVRRTLQFADVLAMHTVIAHTAVCAPQCMCPQHPRQRTRTHVGALVPPQV